MGNIGIWQIVLILLMVMLLFGRGKISELMGDVAKGIKSFKKGLSDEEPPMKTLSGERAEGADTAATTDEAVKR